MIGYLLRLDGSFKDDNGKPTMSRMKSDGAVKFSVTKSVPLFSYFFYASDHVYKVVSLTFNGEFGTILNVRTAKELDALLGTQVVIWVLHFNPVELRICCKIAKLAGSISKERARQSACCLSSFSQWPMMSSSICPLPKLKKWRKLSEKMWSVMLMFCHFVIAWRATWNGRICGSNLNYTLSYALEKMV